MGRVQISPIPHLIHAIVRYILKSVKKVSGCWSRPLRVYWGCAFVLMKNFNGGVDNDKTVMMKLI